MLTPPLHRSGCFKRRDRDLFAGGAAERRPPGGVRAARYLRRDNRALLGLDQHRCGSAALPARAAGAAWESTPRGKGERGGKGEK